MATYQNKGIIIIKNSNGSGVINPITVYDDSLPPTPSSPDVKHPPAPQSSYPISTTFASSPSNVYQGMTVRFDWHKVSDGRGGWMYAATGLVPA